MFTLDDQCTNLYKGLTETNLLSYTKRSVFYGVHDKHVPTVKAYIEHKQIRLVADVPCFIYAIAPQDAKKFTLEYDTYF